MEASLQPTPLAWKGRERNVRNPDAARKTSWLQALPAAHRAGHVERPRGGRDPSGAAPARLAGAARGTGRRSAPDLFPGTRRADASTLAFLMQFTSTTSQTTRSPRGVGPA